MAVAEEGGVSGPVLTWQAPYERKLYDESVFEIMAKALREAANTQDCVTYEQATFDTQALLSDLHGHVIEALQHPHANHVIKQLVEIMPTEHIAFVANELAGSAVWAASHAYGCRSVLRLVRHCGAGGWAGECVDTFFNDILGNASNLCTNEFAKWVLEEFLEHGLPEHQLKIAKALSARLLRNAKDRYASGLIETVLRNCDADVGGELVDKLLQSREAVQSLLRSQFGFYVLRDLALSGQHHLKVQQKLLPLAAELQSTKQGRKLWEILSSSEAAPH